ncbi:MAG: hypothetical protein WCJ62_12330 [Flavobacterium sp.]
MPVVPQIIVTGGDNLPPDTSGNPFTPNSGGGNNPMPVLLNQPTGGEPPVKPLGHSSVVEPDLGLPSNPKGDLQPPKEIPDAITPPPNPIQNIINYLPPFMGGGGGGGGGATDNTTDTSGIAKKPNYVLYIGILLAVIVAYKVLSKKEK